MELAKQWGIGLVTFIVVDAVWLGFIANAFYKRELGPLLRQHANGDLDPRWLPALLLYALIVLGLALFALPRVRYGSVIEAAQLAKAFGGQVAAAPHPIKGMRTTPDEMVGILEIYQQRGEADSPFTPEELAQLVHVEPRPWLLAANDTHRLDANLDFAAGDVHARLELDAEAKHPSLGSGLLMRLKLPVEPDPAVAQRLNANECLEPDSHQLGAWCVDDEHGLMFTGFIPAAAWVPELSRALVYHLSAKNEWARALLFPSG